MEARSRRWLARNAQSSGKRAFPTTRRVLRGILSRHPAGSPTPGAAVARPHPRKRPGACSKAYLPQSKSLIVSSAGKKMSFSASASCSLLRNTLYRIFSTSSPPFIFTWEPCTMGRDKAETEGHSPRSNQRCDPTAWFPVPTAPGQKSTAFSQGSSPSPGTRVSPPLPARSRSSTGQEQRAGKRPQPEARRPPGFSIHSCGA